MSYGARRRACLPLVLAGTTALLGMALATMPKVAAQQSGANPALAMQNADLMPGAPHWVKWASSNVRVRFTAKWQAMAKTVAPLAAGAPDFELAPESGEVAPMGAVSFGQVMFNKDTSILPQNETTVVFDPLNAARVVGAYNDFRGVFSSGGVSGWSISTTGGTGATPVLKDGQLQPAVVAGRAVPSQGDPVLAVDTAGNYFYGSLYIGFDPSTFNTLSGLGIARSPKAGSAQGIFSAACAGGDGDVDCWPKIKIVAGEVCTFSGGHFHDKPYIAVDKSSSVGAGSVYIVWTRFNCANPGVAILAAKCTNSLSSCTAPVVLESTAGTGAFIDFLQLSHIAISPANGKVYLTWNKFFGSSFKNAPDTIRMRVITPNASPAVLGTLGPLRTVVTETLPIPFSGLPYPGVFRTATYPHVAVKGSRAIVVWDRRTTKSLLFDFWYFDSDILAKFTDNDGATFSAPQVVSSAPSFQYQPAICVDAVSGRVVVAYFSAEKDVVSKHRNDIFVATSPTGAAPYTPLRVTSVSNITENDPFNGDFFLGDYLEPACGPNFAYVHYTANYRSKSDASLDLPPVIIKQQDNFLAKVTLPTNQ